MPMNVPAAYWTTLIFLNCNIDRHAGAKKFLSTEQALLSKINDQLLLDVNDGPNDEL
jgi:hypothetical protein